MAELIGIPEEKYVDSQPDYMQDNRRVIVDLYEDTSIDPVYQAKARILNQAIHEIGMGRYQVRA